MLSTNNDVGQHAFKNAKRELRKILNRFKEEGRLRSYTIVPTSNLAVKHPLSNMHVHSILLSLLMLV